MKLKQLFEDGLHDLLNSRLRKKVRFEDIVDRFTAALTEYIDSGSKNTLVIKIKPGDSGKFKTTITYER